MAALCQLQLPDWLQDFMRKARAGTHGGDTAKIELAIALSALSVERGGGPFGAAIFGPDDHLLSAGCNLVMLAQCSHWHAEMVAILSAEQTLGQFDLGPANLTLASSCEPCVMCLGGLLWSGVKRVVCAATDADARAIGFDEGPKPADWAGACRQRGIEVITGLQRPAAQAVLQRYADRGGAIYNPSP